jgi:hypothetical protein
VIRTLNDRTLFIDRSIFGTVYSRLHRRPSNHRSSVLALDEIGCEIRQTLVLTMHSTSVFTLIAYGISAAAAIVGNVLILRAQSAIRQKFNISTNLFITALACTEVFFIVLFAVSMIQTLTADSSAASTHSMVIFACVVTPYLQLLCISFSALCMVAIAVDLFQAVFFSTVEVAIAVAAASTRPPGGAAFPTVIAVKRRRRGLVAVATVWCLSALYATRTAVMSPYSGGVASSSATSDLEMSTSATTTTTTAGNLTISRVDRLTDRQRTTAAETRDDAVTRSSGNIGSFETTEAVNSITSAAFRDSTGGEESVVEACNFFVENNVNDTASRTADCIVLFLFPIAVQIVLYVATARKLWSSHVSFQRSMVNFRPVADVCCF